MERCAHGLLDRFQVYGASIEPDEHELSTPCRPAGLRSTPGFTRLLRLTPESAHHPPCGTEKGGIAWETKVLTSRMRAQSVATMRAQLSRWWRQGLVRASPTCCSVRPLQAPALSKDKDGVGLIFNKLTPAEFQPMLDDLPPDVAARVIYVQSDISKWTYTTFRNLVRKHLDLAVNQLASVHSSPPCTTRSRAHHGKNPHRQRVPSVRASFWLSTGLTTTASTCICTGCCCV